MKNLILAALLGALFVFGCATSSVKATEELETYVANMYPGWVIEGQTVMDHDSDSDGYVSADVRIKDPKTGESKMLALNCAANYSYNNGCKARVGGISQG